MNIFNVKNFKFDNISQSFTNKVIDYRHGKIFSMLILSTIDQTGLFNLCLKQFIKKNPNNELILILKKHLFLSDVLDKNEEILEKKISCFIRNQINGWNKIKFLENNSYSIKFEKGSFVCGLLHGIGERKYFDGKKEKGFFRYGDLYLGVRNKEIEKKHLFGEGNWIKLINVSKVIEVGSFKKTFYRLGSRIDLNLGVRVELKELRDREVRSLGSLLNAKIIISKGLFEKGQMRKGVRKFREFDGNVPRNIFIEKGKFNNKIQTSNGPKTCFRGLIISKVQPRIKAQGLFLSKKSRNKTTYHLYKGRGDSGLYNDEKLVKIEYPLESMKFNKDCNGWKTMFIDVINDVYNYNESQLISAEKLIIKIDNLFIF
ncbi:MAG: hypothetical protein Q8K60_01210 [Parachlamydiaceae bacterium]|nr:hypothetical protein [Parachlamydiaceae bacterium]